MSLRAGNDDTKPVFELAFSDIEVLVDDLDSAAGVCDLCIPMIATGVGEVRRLRRVGHLTGQGVGDRGALVSSIGDGPQARVLNDQADGCAREVDSAAIIASQ